MTGLDGPSGAERTEPARITATGLDGSSGAEGTESAHITATGLDGPSGAERTESAHIENAGLDGSSGAEDADKSSGADKTEPAHITATGLDGPSGAERTESARITATGLDGSSGAEGTEPARITATGLDGSSGAEGTEPARITATGLDGPSGADKTDVVSVGPRSGLQYVRMTRAMCEALEVLELQAFPTADPADLYNEEEFLVLADEFPEGSVVGFDGDGRDEPVALGLGVRTHFDFDHPQHSLKEFFATAPTGSGDDPDGPWYYGTDIVVRPDYRRRGIGRELYDLRKQMCVDLNLAGIVAGGVIPGYAEHKHAMSADEYVARVVTGELYDPTLTFQLENGFEAPCALQDYIQDPAVDNFASLIVWHNPTYVAPDAERGGTH